MKKEIVKLVVTVPESHADEVRKALGDSGAGVIGAYHHCSFSVKGIGRFVPASGANPYIGEVGQAEEVVEERIETPCYKDELPQILAAVRRAHPYEEPVIELYPLIDLEEIV